MSGRYDYECPGCGIVELEHSMNTNRNEQVCPICGVDVEPLISCVQLDARAEFTPYKLENGPLKRVEDDPHFDNGKKGNGRRGIWIQSKRHENEIMYRMGCHFGERGEKMIGDQRIGDSKPEDKLHIRR